VEKVKRPEIFVAVRYDAFKVLAWHSNQLVVWTCVRSTYSFSYTEFSWYLDGWVPVDR